MSTFRLRDYQEEVVSSVIDSGGIGLLAMPLGSGKTAMAVEIARRLNARTILVVAPLNTHGGWERHFDMLMPGLPVQRITKNGVDLIEGVNIIGWERNRAYNWDGGAAFDLVIADESARMGSSTAQQTKQTKAVWSTLKAPHKLALSATPAGNKPERIWSTLHWLWPERYRAFWPFVKQFFVKKMSPFGIIIAGEKRPGSVARLIPCYEYRSAEEVHKELPEVVTHEVNVDLTPAQRKVYRQFETRSLAWLDDHPVAAELPAVQYLRLLQVCLAVPKVEVSDKGEETVGFAEPTKSSKLDALAEILGDLPADENVLVWTHSKKFIPAVVARLQSKGHSVAAVHGGQSRTDREAAISGFGTHHRVLVATVAALGEGVDGLQHVCATEVFLSLSDSPTMNRQAQGRLRRPGQARTINRYMVRATDTLETRQLGRLVSGEDMLTASGFL